MSDLLEIEEYTYIDLEEVNELIKKFVSNYNIVTTNFATLNSTDLKNNDLFILITHLVSFLETYKKKH